MTEPILLPYPPSANRYWRSFRGRMVRSAEANTYRDITQQTFTEAGVDLFEEPVVVRMELHPVLPADWERRQKKDPHWWLRVRRLDLDNAQKVVLDALQGVCFVNDRMVTKLTISLGEPVSCGGLSVRVYRDTRWV